MTGNTSLPSSYRKNRGDEGEAMAAAWLESKGWKILQRNFRIRGGEVDIIARDGVFLSFVEVKHWGSEFMDDLGRVLGAPKKSRMRKAAGAWLSANAGSLWQDHLVRFDLVTVDSRSREITLFAGALNF